MYYSLLMKIRDTTQNLLKNALGLELGVEFLWLFGNLIEDLLAVNELHHKMHFSWHFIFNKFSDFQNIEMAQVFRKVILVSVGHFFLLVIIPRDFDSKGIQFLQIFNKITFIDGRMHTFSNFFVDYVFGFKGMILLLIEPVHE